MAFQAPNSDLVEYGDNLIGFNAEEDVIRGQAVKVDADMGVEPSDADGENVIGMATQTKSSGSQVTVALSGCIVRLTAGAAVTAGAGVATHGSTGEEGEIADSASGDVTIGTALEGGSDGDLVRVWLDTSAAAQVN